MEQVVRNCIHCAKDVYSASMSTRHCAVPWERLQELVYIGVLFASEKCHPLSHSPWTLLVEACLDCEDNRYENRN